MEDSCQKTQIVNKGSKKREYLIGGGALAVTLALCVAVVIYWEYLGRFQQYEYLGVFIISILAGATVVVPVPSLIVVFTLGSVLAPAIIGALAGIGEASGSLVVYLTGYGGRKPSKAISSRFNARFEDWIRRRGSLAVFLMSAVFNPLFYPFAVVAGMMRFALVKFFLLCWAGKTVKNMGVAYLGYFGLGSLLRWVGYIFP